MVQNCVYGTKLCSRNKTSWYKTVLKEQNCVFGTKLCSRNKFNGTKLCSRNILMVKNCVYGTRKFVQGTKLHGTKLSILKS